MAVTDGSTSSSSLEEERNEFEISLKIRPAHLAQSVEHAAVNRRVVGSSPTVGATKPLKTLRFRGFHHFFAKVVFAQKLLLMITWLF